MPFRGHGRRGEVEGGGRGGGARSHQCCKRTRTWRELEEGGGRLWRNSKPICSERAREEERNEEKKKKINTSKRELGGVRRGGRSHRWEEGRDGR